MSQTLRKALLCIVVTHLVTVLGGEGQILQQGPSLRYRVEVTLGESVGLAGETMRGIATGWQCETSSQQGRMGAARAEEVIMRWPKGLTIPSTGRHLGQNRGISPFPAPADVHSAVKFTKDSWRAKPVGPFSLHTELQIADFCRGHFQGNTHDVLIGKVR